MQGSGKWGLPGEAFGITEGVNRLKTAPVFCLLKWPQDHFRERR